MAVVTGLTAARMLEIEAASVVDGDLLPDGHLQLTKHDGSTVDAGSILVTMALLRDMMYPVGVIYMSVSGTSPATLFGGTWSVWGSGRVPVGVDTAQTEFDTVEEVGGEKNHLLVSSEMPIHTHVQDPHTHIQNSHTHIQNSHTHTQDAHNHSQNSHNHNQNSHNHNPPVAVNYGGDASANRSIFATNSPFWSMGDGNNAVSATTAVNQAATATNQVATATNQAATATNQVATATNQTTTATNQNAGGGLAHNNLQPYVTCYMWKRTA